MVAGVTEETTTGIDLASNVLKIPSLESVASSVDEDSEAIVATKGDSRICGIEGRDDISAVCLTNNPCVDYAFLSESRHDLHNLDDARQQGSSVDKSKEDPVASLIVPIEKSLNSQSGEREQDDPAHQEDGSSYFDTLCSQPYEMLVKAAAQSHSTTEQSTSLSLTNQAIDGDEPFGTASTGKMFDDLPSLASISVNLPLIETLSDSESFMAVVEDLVLLPESKSVETPEADEGVVEGEVITEPEKLAQNTFGGDDLYPGDEILSNQSSSGIKAPLTGITGALTRTRSNASKSQKEAQPSSETRLAELRAAREEHGRYDIRCANLSLTVADQFCEEGDYTRAFSLYREALSVFTAKLGDYHATTIDCKVHVGKALQKLGKHDAAIHEYHTVLQMRKDLNGEKDVTVADTIVLISRALREKNGRFPQALKELKRALKMYRACLGDSNAKVAETVDDIASLYMMSGNHVKAIAILDEVVKLKAATNGMYTIGVAASLSQLSRAQQSAGDTRSALSSLKKAHSIYSHIDGEDGDKTTESLQKLARFYMEIGNYQRAINASMGVLNRRKRTLGNADPCLADTYVDLGVSLQQTGDYTKATKCLKLALTLCLSAAEKTGMQDTGKIANVMHELGVVHQLNGRTKDAIKVFKQEVVVRKKMGPNERHRLARSLFYLGTGNFDLGQHTVALSCLTEAIEIYTKLGDNLGMDYAEALFSLGLVLKTTKHDDKARQAFFESLRLFYSHGLPNDHELVKMAGAKLKQLGHKCQCPYRLCTQVPCQSARGSTKC